MKRLLLPFAFFAASFSASACINGETRELKDGTRLFSDWVGEVNIPHPHNFSRIDYAATMARLEAGWRRTGNAEYRSDMGVLLILQKKYSEARDLYLDLERRNPGRYSTASNLGTTYELMGKNDSALFWIGRAVAIDPGSHNGSEWVHVNILKAKVAGKADPSTQDLLGTDFGRGPQPVATISRDSLHALDAALSYQLTERMSFIAPPDPVIGRLLYEMGNINMLVRNYYTVAELYDAAERYGYRDTLLERRRLELLKLQLAESRLDTSAAGLQRSMELDSAMRQASIKRELKYRQDAQAPYRHGLFWAIGAGFVLLAAFIGVLFLRRNR